MPKAPRRTRPPSPRLEPPPTEQLKPTQFTSGPENKGRPAGSRNRLQGSFLRELSADFDRYGRAAIMRAREEDPLGYVRVVASLMPKELEFKRALEEYDDEQLRNVFEAVAASLKVSEKLSDADLEALLTMKQPGTVQ